MKRTIPTGKHGAGSVMFWGRFAAVETSLDCETGIMDSFKNEAILEPIFCDQWTYQQDTDSKNHGSKLNFCYCRGCSTQYSLLGVESFCT